MKASIARPVQSEHIDDDRRPRTKLRLALDALAACVDPSVWGPLAPRKPPVVVPSDAFMPTGCRHR